MLNKALIIITFVFLLIGCTNKVVIRKNKLNRKSDELLSFVQDHDTGFNTYSIKYAGEYIEPNSSKKFTGMLRIIQGRVIWISLGPGLGIETARLLFTPGEIKFVNRHQKNYFVSDYSYFANKYDINVSYDMIERILTNRFVILGSDSGKNNENIEETTNGQVELTYSNHNTKETYTINRQFKKLTGIIFTDLNKDAELRVSFSEYIDIDAKKLPQRIELDLRKKDKSIQIIFHYKKLTVDKKFKTPFKIPSKYQQIWP